MTSVPHEVDLRRRTPGERLWLWRRRQLSDTGRARSKVGSGMSQAEAAAALGVTHVKYHDAESDKLPGREILLLLAQAHAEGADDPSRGELCALARRRARLTLRDASESLGVSRVTYLERERSGAPEVVEAFRTMGFIF